MGVFAHSVKGAPECGWERFPHHAMAVGERAAMFAEPFASCGRWSCLTTSANARLPISGAVQAIRPTHYGDRFVVLESMSLYDDAVGLGLDEPTWRSSESNVM